MGKILRVPEPESELESFDRQFIDLLYDGIALLRLAERRTDDLRSALSRASLLASLLLVEAAANICLESLELGRTVHEQLDRLPLIGKFEIFVRMRFRNRRLDRGTRPVEILRELKLLRDTYAHPKVHKVVWEKGLENEVVAADPKRTPILKVPLNPNFWQPEDASSVMRGSHVFLAFLLRDTCRFKPPNVSSLLFSLDAVPRANAAVIPYFKHPVQMALKRWQVDLSYCSIRWESR